MKSRPKDPGSTHDVLYSNCYLSSMAQNHHIFDYKWKIIPRHIISNL